MNSTSIINDIKNDFFEAVEHSVKIADDSTDKISEKNAVQKSNNLIKSSYNCEVCCKQFTLKSNYEKHLKNYPFKHNYFKCCKKIEGHEVIHICRWIKNKKNFTDKDFGDKVKKEDEEADENGDVPEKEEVNDGHDDDDDDDDDDDQEDVDENELFGKKERPSKKKLTEDENEESNFKIYKCQECLELFNKYSSLSQHSKLIHNKNGKHKCQICDEEFNTDQDYDSHLALHGPEDKVICRGCQKTFDSLKAFYVHAKQNPGVHCFLCKLCLRKFPTELMLEQHVCICQNGKPLHCACGKEFTKYYDVITHSKGTKPFKCCSCPHLATSLTAYIRHLRKHSKQKPYQCTKCDMKFAVIDFLNIHNKKYHSDSGSEPLKEQNSEQINTERYLCTFCDEEFKSEEELKKHGLQHERVQCPDCGKLLKRNRLENHRNTHKTSASLCPKCGKLFETRFKLTQHIITTHNNEPVKCEICGKVLKTKKILNEHMKTHLKSEVGERVPQAICPMCGLGLAQKGSLARHILLTHEKHKIVPCNKPYTCQECSAVLPNRAKYYSHRRMHKALVDRFPCEVCGREFNKKQNLRRHMYLLHDEKRVLADPIFKCQICTRCFREKKNLKRHYKMVHKLEDVV